GTLDLPKKAPDTSLRRPGECALSAPKPCRMKGGSPSSNAPDTTMLRRPEMRPTCPEAAPRQERPNLPRGGTRPILSMPLRPDMRPTPHPQAAPCKASQDLSPQGTASPAPSRASSPGPPPQYNPPEDMVPKSACFGITRVWPPEVVMVV